MSDEDRQEILDAQEREDQKRLQELEEEELWLRSPPDETYDEEDEQ